MTISYSIDNRLGGVFTTATGCLTDEELLEDNRKLTVDPEFRSGLIELMDARSVTDLKITPEGIEHLVMQDAADAERLENYRLAMVVSKDAAFGLARMYETMTQHNMPNVKVFRDMNDARRWLGLPAEDVADAG